MWRQMSLGSRPAWWAASLCLPSLGPNIMHRVNCRGTLRREPPAWSRREPGTWCESPSYIATRSSLSCLRVHFTGHGAVLTPVSWSLLSQYAAWLFYCLVNHDGSLSLERSLSHLVYLEHPFFIKQSFPPFLHCRWLYLCSDEYMFYTNNLLHVPLNTATVLWNVKLSVN